VLYSTLVDLSACDELLALDTPHLEHHLAREGGLPAGGPPPTSGGRIGPLGKRQVQLLELLCRLYVSKRRCAGTWQGLPCAPALPAPPRAGDEGAGWHNARRTSAALHPALHHWAGSQAPLHAGATNQGRQRQPTPRARN
jgi:hypothetical protein